MKGQHLQHRRGPRAPDTSSVCALGVPVEARNRPGLKSRGEVTFGGGAIKGPGQNGTVVVFVKHSLGAMCRVSVAVHGDSCDVDRDGRGQL